MNLTDLIILAAVLGVDCLVLSFSQGLVLREERFKNSFLLALTMGLFQGAMPFISYSGIYMIADFIEPFGDIIVFTIFFLLGLKFIKEAFLPDNDIRISCINFKSLIILGIATSIDAFGAGINLGITGVSLPVSLTVIGLMSFLMSECGFWLGNIFKELPTKTLMIVCGIILILLAVKSIFY